MEDYIVKKGLDSTSILIFHKEFNKSRGCNWTLEQVKQSLKNQEYLKFLVFEKEDTILGIISYSKENPWNRFMFTIEYFANEEILEYMKTWKEKIREDEKL